MEVKQEVKEEVKLGSYPSKEGMRVTKLSGGNYTWEVKILGDHFEIKDVDRLEELENEIKKRYGKYDSLKNKSEKGRINGRNFK